MSLQNLLMVGLGGFFGAIARYIVSKQYNKSTYRIPLGTMAVNTIGAFLLGFLMGVKAGPMMLLLFGTGFMGAFTTFSTLKLEMTKMFKHKHYTIFFLYTVLTYGLGITLAYIGFLFGTSFNQ